MDKLDMFLIPFIYFFLTTLIILYPFTFIFMLNKLLGEHLRIH